MNQIAVRDMHMGEPAYQQYSPEMIALFGKTIMPNNYKTEELYMLLELAATYRLDPFAKEIWAARMSSRNGDNGAISILVGRDGLLAIAERHPDFRGFRNSAVYEHDTFRRMAKAVEQPDGTWSHFEHEYDFTGTRGEVIGAYAEVYREGRPPVEFWAPLGDYMKGGDSATPWKKQKNVMIEKCALATALRLAFRISGLYIADEMSNALLEKNTVSEEEVAVDNWGDDVEVRDRLGDLFALLNAQTDGAYMPAKIKLTLAGLDDAGRVELIKTLEEEYVKKGGELPIDVVAVEVTDEDAAEPVEETAEAKETGAAEEKQKGKKKEPEQETLV